MLPHSSRDAEYLPGDERSAIFRISFRNKIDAPRTDTDKSQVFLLTANKENLYRESDRAMHACGVYVEEES